MMSSALPIIADSSTVPTTSTTRRALATTSTSPPSFPTTTTQTQTRPRNASNTPMQIFVDPSGSAAQSTEMQLNAWPDIGTRKTRIKENTQGTKKLAGTTLKQAGKAKRVASGSSGSRIVPYRDPGPDEMPPPPPPFVSDGAPCTPVRASQFTPFTDPDPEPPVPSTPKFTPFCDEVSRLHPIVTVVLRIVLLV